MRLTRLYQPGSLKEGETIEIHPSGFHHLIKVLRLPLHRPFILFNGEGGEFLATLSRIEKHRAYAILTQFNSIEREASLKIHLGQGIAKGDKMDFIIQKATELGVTHFTPLLTDYCNVKLSQERLEKRLNHWKEIAINACEQSGRNRIPVIDLTQSSDEWIAHVTENQKIVFHPDATQTMRDLNPSSLQSYALFIGSEGGLSDREIQQAKDAGFHLLTLGPRILRTETATIAALALLQGLTGNLG